MLLRTFAIEEGKMSPSVEKQLVESTDGVQLGQ